MILHNFGMAWQYLANIVADALDAGKTTAAAATARAAATNTCADEGIDDTAAGFECWHLNGASDFH